jgi:hypothetical protein
MPKGGEKLAEIHKSLAQRYLRGYSARTCHFTLWPAGHLREKLEYHPS